MGLLVVFARERRARIDKALALSHAYRGTALLMSDLLEADDAYTGGEHSHGVVALALAVGDALGLDARDRRNLEFAALLHDIGKIRVPDEIINKPGKLTDEEFALIKRHPSTGRRCSSASAACSPRSGVIVRHHHERWDGGGYPDGIAGEAIPLRGAHHLRLRRLQRDDDQPPLPRGAARRRRASPSSSAARARSSTRRSSTRCCGRSPSTPSTAPPRALLELAA